MQLCFYEDCLKLQSMSGLMRAATSIVTDFQASVVRFSARRELFFLTAWCCTLGRFEEASQKTAKIAPTLYS
jgi:hypothetical protein